MSKDICFYNEDVAYRLLCKEKIRLWFFDILKEEKKDNGVISFIFCSDEYLLGINRQYLDADYFTDVITFDFTGNDYISGDVFISVDRVKENAKLYKQKYYHEMLRVMLHGVLHLCGYKDKTDKQERQMRKKEDYYLQKFNSNS